MPIAFALVLVGLGILSLAPALHDERVLRDRLTAQLSNWTGGSVAISGPMRLSYFPVIALRAQAVHIGAIDRIPALRDVRAKAMQAELSLWSLLFSSEPAVQHLTLTEPRLALDARGGATSAAGREPPLVRALRSVPAARITIAGGSVTVSGAQATEEITGLTADLAVDRSGAASGEGAFQWRGERISVALSSDAPTLVASTAKSPVRVDFTSSLITARIEGEATITDGMQLHGDLDLAISDMRRFANWMGLLVPDGPGLGDFTATGSFNWLGQRISFDDGSFALDGNNALGAMALKYNGARPAIEGTLALDTLDVSPYLPVRTSAASADGKSEDGVLRLDFPILHHLDVDLRVSTAQVRASGLTLGQSAFSVSLAAGKLAADFSVLNLCDGKGNGRLELNSAVPLPRFDLAATVSNASAQTCIKSFAAASPVEGRANLAVKLTSEGRNSRELLKRLAGDVTLSMTAGQAHIDLAKVLVLARKRDLRGWQAVSGTPTRFDSLTAQFDFDKGNAHSDSLKVRTGKTTITGEGTIDLASRRLNWRLVLGNKVTDRIPRLRALVARLADALVISGPLSDPTIRFKRIRASSGGTGNLHAALR